MSETNKLSFQIRAKLKEHGVDASVLKFGEGKLKTGELLVWEGDALAQGVAIMIETPEGLLPAPDGVHELEDGSMVEVSGGIVTAVKPAEMEEPETEAPAVTAPVAEQSAPSTSPAAKAVIESTIKETRFSKEEAEELFMAKTDKEALEAKFTEQSESINTLSKKVNELTSQLTAVFEIVQKISEQPAEQPAEKPKHPLAFARAKQDEDTARVHALLKLAKEKQNQ
jgi:Asp-tRNA(Asn)/Glu-tRNA(Gln) amidotransferase C subunit